MDEKPIQHYYPDEVAVCYGCGRNNPKGLQIETRWDGEEGVCRFTPEPHYTAFPGFVYMRAALRPVVSFIAQSSYTEPSMADNLSASVSLSVSISGMRIVPPSPSRPE